MLAQDADPCEAVPSAKATKLIEKGTDKRKYDADKRRGYLEDALEEDDTALEAAFALGLLAHTEARRNGGAACPKRGPSFCPFTRPAADTTKRCPTPWAPSLTPRTATGTPSTGSTGSSSGNPEPASPLPPGTANGSNR